jgi:spermidine/putrescine transport system permease protein
MNKTIRTLIKANQSFFMSIPAFMWVILFFYVPLMTVIGRSFLVTTNVSAIPVASVEHYTTFLDWTYIAILKRSLLVAFVTSIICLIIAYPIAYFIARKAGKAKNVFLFFIMLPFSVNLLIQTYAWFFMLGKTGLINSILLKLHIISQPLHLLNSPGALYVVMVYCYLPFMILPLYTVLEKIDERYKEASLDLGASWKQTIAKVLIPLSLPGISTGFLLVFIPVFGELVIPALVGGGKQMYVSTLISYYFLTTRNLALGSAFTVLSSALVLIVAYFLYHRLKKMRS